MIHNQERHPTRRGTRLRVYINAGPELGRQSGLMCKELLSRLESETTEGHPNCLQAIKP